MVEMVDSLVIRFKKIAIQVISRSRYLRFTWGWYRNQITDLNYPNHVQVSLATEKTKLGSMYLLSPADLPRNRRFFMLRDECHLPESLSTFSVIASEDNFMGYLDDITQANEIDCSVLVCSANWPRLVDDLTAVGIPRDRLLVALPDLGDPWGYWEMLGPIANHFTKIAGNRVELPWSKLAPQLKNVEVRPLSSERLYVWNGNYLRGFRDLIDTNRESIGFVSSRLADKASRDSYELLLQGDPTILLKRYLETVAMKRQYFDYITLAPGDVVINGGVHMGSEIPAFLSMIGKQGQLWCIDPGGSNYLHQFVQPCADYFGNAIHWLRAALWNRNGMLNLPQASDGQYVGKLANQQFTGMISNEEVECIRLDDLVEKHALSRVHYIKLDLEGAEPEALEGMAQAITKFRPQMAISIYHKPEHMWEIPLWMMTRWPDYSYFVDSYSYQRWECILYCIPNPLHEGSVQPKI